MLKETQVDAVKRLYAAGIKQRQIARQTGISRGSVGAIVHGRRPDYAARRAKGNEYEASVLNQAKVRCGGCGGLQELPCRVCRGRATARTPKQQRLNAAREALEKALHPVPADATLHLELREEALKRYAEVRKRREADEGAAGCSDRAQKPSGRLRIFDPDPVFSLVDDDYSDVEEHEADDDCQDSVA